MKKPRIKLTNKKESVEKILKCKNSTKYFFDLIQCPVENCLREYGTETALKKHLRGKHMNEAILEEGYENDNKD